MLEYILAISLAVIVGPYIHEGSHWFIGWLGNTKPEVQFVFLIVPNGVFHREIESMDTEIIRFSGLAPLLWLPVTFLAILLLLIQQTPMFLFIATTLVFNILMSTKSDALAFRDPEQYREKVMYGEISREPLLLPDLPKWIPRF